MLHTTRTLAIGTLLAAAALPATASAKTATPNCAAAPTFKAFAAFGDTANYSLAPGGDFETAGAGWTFTNAGVVAGNETAGVVSGKNSLQLGLSATAGTASATSPEFCVNDDFPSFRFLTKSATGRATNVSIGLSYRRLDQLSQVRTESTTAALPFSAGWTPSAITPLATLLTSGNGTQGKLVRVTFTVSAADVKAGGVSVDNVLIDPYRRS